MFAIFGISSIMEVTTILIGYNEESANQGRKWQLRATLVEQYFKSTATLSKENVKSNSCLDILDNRYNTENTNSLIRESRSEISRLKTYEIKQNWYVTNLEDCCELSVNKESNTSTNQYYCIKKLPVVIKKNSKPITNQSYCNLQCQYHQKHATLNKEKCLKPARLV
jgi:hypothetical protein